MIMKSRMENTIEKNKVWEQFNIVDWNNDLPNHF